MSQITLRIYINLALSVFSSCAFAQAALPNYINSGVFGTGTLQGPVKSGDAFQVTRYDPANCPVADNGYCNGYMDIYSYGNSIFRASNSYTDGKTAALSQQLALMSARFDNALSRQNRFFSEGIAMASSIEVLPPNPGDRFSINLGGAGYNNQAAGSVSVSVRLTESMLGYVGYARSLNQNLVKGGFSLSIH